jgi:hypothetical protein
MKMFQQWVLGSGDEVHDHHSHSDKSHY